jgi:hypothetical protein
MRQNVTGRIAYQRQFSAYNSFVDEDLFEGEMRLIKREKELEMLRRYFLVGLMALGALMAPVNSFARSAHISEAIKELREGITEGRKGMASSFVEHMHNALDHTQAANKERFDHRNVIAIAEIKKALKIAKGTGHHDRLQKGVTRAVIALHEIQREK